MIIKIDHIAYSSMDLESDIEIFKTAGYELVFKEQHLKNLDIKKRFLKNFEQTHQLALMKKENSYNIELLNHNNINPYCGFISPYNFNDKFFNKIIIKTNSIENSTKFWNMLGFSTTQEFAEMIEMKFSSPVEHNVFYIYLSYNKTKKNFLDDKDFNCIALITNSAKKEQENIIKKGFTTSEIDELDVNGQKLKIFFAQRNNCEIVEIIEIVRKK